MRGLTSHYLPLRLVVQAESHTIREIDLITLPAGHVEGVAEAALPPTPTPFVISPLHLVFG